MKENYSASNRKDLDPQMPNITSIKMIKDRIMCAAKRNKIAVFHAIDIDTGRGAFECYHADICYTARRIKDNDRHYVGSFFGRKGAEDFAKYVIL